MKEYTKGLVSVVMPTYKRSEKLLRAIDSVLDQTYHNIELLLVNDNEPDGKYSLELINRTSKYKKDSRFHLIHQEKHINGAVARNVGIKKARGEYIAFLDDDDWWKSNKIEIQVNALSQLTEDWGGVSCLIERYDNEVLVSKQPSYREGYVYKDVLMLLSDFETGSLLLRHKALDNTGYFDESLLRHQDLQLLVNFTCEYKLKQVQEYLLCRDISDAKNRLDGDALLKQKKCFFDSVKPVMESMSKKERHCIYCVHYFEIGYVYLKNHKWIHGITYCSRILTSFQAFRCTMNRILSKVKS